MSTSINNVSPDEVDLYKNDNNKPEYYPSIEEGLTWKRDDTKVLLNNLAFIKRQLLKSVIDTYNDTIDYADPANEDKLADIDDPNMYGVEYDNEGFRDYEDGFFPNANIPIGWNAGRIAYHVGIGDWEEKDLDVTLTDGNWQEIVEAMGAWYAINIHTYQGTAEKPRKGRTYYDCSLFPSGPRGVGDDCTGFCWACVQYYWDVMHDKNPENCDQAIYDEIMKITWGPCSVDWGHPDKGWPEKMAKYGFEYHKYNKSDLQPFDMVMGSVAAGAKHGHGEIYAGKENGKMKTYSWGRVHDEAHGGLPSPYADYDYTLIYRIKST